MNDVQSFNFSVICLHERFKLLPLVKQILLSYYFLVGSVDPPCSIIGLVLGYIGKHLKALKAIEINYPWVNIYCKKVALDSTKPCKILKTFMQDCIH